MQTGKHEKNNQVAVMVYSSIILAEYSTVLQKDQKTTKLLWDLQSQTNKYVKTNQANTVIRDKEQKTEYLAIPSGANIQRKKY